MSLFDRRIRHANGPFVIQASENTYEIVPQSNIAEYAVGNLTVFGNLYVKRFGLPDWTVDKNGAYAVDQGGTGHTSIEPGKFLVGNAMGQLIVTSDMSWTSASGLEVGRLTVETDAANVLYANSAFVDRLQALTSFTVPVGNTETRPDPPNVGHVRFNVDTSSYEGFVGSSWGSLGGVKDVDGDSYVAAEFYPGSNDNNLRFVTGGAEWMRITGNGNVAVGQVAIENPRADLHVSGTTLLANLFANVARVTGNLYADIVRSRDVHVTGNLVVEGNTIAVNQELIETQNPRIVVNKSATGFYNENTTVKSGMEVYRGTLEPYLFVFDEPTDLFKIGIEDSLQAVATRRDTVLANTVPFWNASLDLYDHDANLRYENGTLVTGTIVPYESATQDLGSQATRFRDVYLSNAIVSNVVIANAIAGDGFFLANLNPENVTGTVSVVHGGTARDSLTANLVLVGNAHGPVTSASGLYYANERLGIRTNGPTEALDVSGNVRADMFMGDGSLLSNLLPSQIPALDASKITTGILPVVRGGTGTTASTGTGNVVLSDSPTLHGLLTVEGNIVATTIECIAEQGTPPIVLFSAALVSNLNADLLDGHHGTYYLDLTNATGLLSNVHIPPIDASFVSSGLFDATRIPALNASHVPSLDASFVATGTLSTSRIPALDASFVSTGTLEGARIPVLNASQVPSLDASFVSTGTLSMSRIPALDASFVSSGVLDAARVPTLNASFVSSGLFDVARIPALDASFVSSGTLGGARIPLLNASQVPSLDVSKLTTGTLAVVRGGTGTTTSTGSGSVVLSAGPTLTGTAVFGNLESSSGTVSASRLISVVATGTAPLTVASTTLVANLNADLLDGQEGSFYLNATNINAGTLGAARIPALDASWITTGTFAQARIPSLASSQIPALNASFVASGTLSALRIPLLNASHVPSLDAGKIATGTFAAARVPALDASWITAGTLNALRIPVLNASHVPSLDASFVTTGTLSSSRIPSLDASFVSSGTLSGTRVPLLNASHVPPLNASYVSSGILGAARIPALDASFIATGVFVATRVPALDASWTTSGTFAQARIPSLDASWITSGIQVVTYGGTGRSTLTANRVLVGNGANAVEPATNLFWDPGASRLGINTVAPTEALEVDGTVKADFFSGDAAFVSNVPVSSLAGTIPVSAGGTGRTTLTSSRVLVGNGANPVDPATNLFWDRTNARLGINTILPSTALDVTGSLTISGNVSIGGDITVLGNTTTLSTETVLVEDNILVLNAGLTGVPPSNLVSGIEVERGTEPNYQFVFEEATDLFKVGLTNGLQAVATRADVVPDKTIAFWNSTGQRFDSDANVTVESSSVRARTFNSTIASGTAPLTVTSTTLVANLNADLLDGQDGSFYLNATNINAGTLGTARIPALDASWITTGTFAQARIPSLASSQIPALDASFVASGTLNALRIPLLNASHVPSLDAGKITTGTFVQARIPALDASWITAGTLNALRIPLLNASHVPNLDTSKLTTGTLGVARGGTGQATLGANKVLVGNGTTGILSPANLHWDNTNSRLGLGTSTPTFDLEIANRSVLIGNVSLASTTIPGTTPSSNTPNFCRLVFDNSFNGTNGSGTGANKIVLHNNNWLAGFGLESGAVTYHSGDEHRFYTGANNTTTYGTLRLSVTSSGMTLVGTAAATTLAGALNASWVNAGTFVAARIPALNASWITAGVFATARIPALDASWITTGVFNAARIPTLNQNTTGNAATATVLQTARTINGTSFNGGADITTANWGTARTLTIGSTGKSVDGSAAVSWSLAEIGAAATNQTMHIGTTAVAINRASDALTLAGVSVGGSAASLSAAINASWINAGAFAQARIPALNASWINAGAFNALRIPLLNASHIPNLDTAKLTTGTLGVARGGTGQATLGANKVLVGNGTTGILSPTNLHWDNTNSRLGIGATSPGQQLVVSSGTNTIVRVHGSSPSIEFKRGTVTDTWGGTAFADWAVAVLDGASPDFIVRVKYTGVEHTPVTVKFDTGRIGIMNSNPSSALDVAGTVTASGGNFTGSIVVDGSVQSSLGYRVGDLEVIDASGNFVAGGLRLTSASGDPALIVDSTGRVGIGTASPFAPLHVNATSSTGPDANGIYVFNPTNSANQHAIVTMRTAGSSAGNPYVSWDVQGVQGWAMGIDRTDASKLKINQAWNSLSSNTVMTITVSNFVGIGVTAPNERLEVSGFVRSSSGYKVGATEVINSSGNISSAARVPALNASWINAGVFAQARIPALNASWINAGVFAQARIPALNASWINAGTLPVARGGTGTTTSTGSGNVVLSIGPTFTSGITISGGLAANTWIGASIGGAGGTNVVVIGNLGGTAHIGGHNQALTGWADLIFQRDGGNVGIGVQTPGFKLDVNGTGRFTSDLYTGWINTTSGDRGNTTPSRFYASDDAWLRFYTRNTYKMHIGLTAKYDRGRVQDTTDTNYWTGAMGWGTTDWNTVATWGSGFVDSWSSPANRPGDGQTHHVGIQTFHYTAAANNAYGWQMVGGPSATWSLRHAWGTWSAWFTILHSGNFNSFSPTLTGGGASGTWGINVTGSSGSCTGNAATATALQTARTINGVSFNGTANITVNGLNYNVNDTWLREQGDNATFRCYGNTRQMVFRTDGTTQYASNIGAFPFVWMYGGDAAANRRMLLDGNLWTSNYGWLHDYFMRRNIDGWITSSDGNERFWFANGSTTYVRSAADIQLRTGGDTTRFTLSSGGDLSVTGNITAYSSDKRLKTNIRDIQGALEKVLSLRGTVFDWIPGIERLGFIPTRKTNEVGLLAQDVQEVLPEAVAPAPFDQEYVAETNTYKSKTGRHYLTVQYEKLVPLLVEAIKDLKKEKDDEISKLKRDLVRLQQEKDEDIADLKEENAFLKSELDAIKDFLGLSSRSMP